MKFRLFAFICFTCCSQISFGQEINIYKTFGGFRFERDSVPISPRMVLDIVKDNPLAYAEFKKAKSNLDAAGVMGFAGGLLIGFPVGTLIAGGDPEWGLAAGGVALILAAIPITSSFKNHALNALDAYNANASSRRVKVNFYLAGAGGKLVIRF